MQMCSPYFRCQGEDQRGKMSLLTTLSCHWWIINTAEHPEGTDRPQSLLLTTNHAVSLTLFLAPCGVRVAFPAGCPPCLCCAASVVWMCMLSSLPGTADLCGGRKHRGELDCQRRGPMAWGWRQQSACSSTASVLGYLFKTIPNLNCIRLEYSLESNHLLPLKAKAGF